MRNLPATLAWIGLLLLSSHISRVSGHACDTKMNMLIDGQSEQPVIPGHVYNRVLTLELLLDQAGLPGVASTSSILLDNPLPHHNFFVAHDLFTVLQLWIQHKDRTLHEPRPLLAPADIQPIDVLNLMNASISALLCRHTQHTLRKEPPPRETLTPTDVFMRLEVLVRRILADIPEQHTYRMLNAKRSITLYLLQDLLIEKGVIGIVDWSPQQNAATQVSLQADSLQTLGSLTGEQLVIRVAFKDQVNFAALHSADLLMTTLIYSELLRATETKITNQIPIVPAFSSANSEQQLQRVQLIAEYIDRLVEAHKS